MLRRGHALLRLEDAAKAVPLAALRLRLQNQSEESHFVAPYTMPIGSLLEEAVLPPSPGFSTEPRRVLREFLDEMRSGLGAVSAASAAEPASGHAAKPGQRRLKASKVTPPASTFRSSWPKRWAVT